MAAVFECRASGAGVSDNNGGCYAPLRVSTFSGTDLVVDGVLNTKVTSASHNFVAADVGTRIQISGGTGWTTGFYTINSAASNAATLNASPAPVGTTGGTWTEVGQDYSQQNAPQVAVGGGVVTSSVTTNVITFTGGTYAPTNADVGNHVQVISGTNTTPGTFLQITATTPTTWTMDANVVSAGTSTNVVANMGGAILTLAKLAANMIASNKAYCTGSFGTTATITFAQTVASPLAASPATRLIGYSASRGDTGMATVTLSTTAAQTVLNMTGSNFWIEQMSVDCGTVTTSKGIVTSTGGLIRNCKVANFTSTGITTGTSSAVVNTEVTGGTAAASQGILAGNSNIIRSCFIHDNVCPGVTVGSGGIVEANLVANNSGASSDGIQMTALTCVIGNTVHNSGRHGIAATSTTENIMVVRDNLLSNNAGFGINLTTGTAFPALPLYDGNGYYNNNGGVSNAQRGVMDSTTGFYGVTPYVNVSDVILTQSPYVGPTTGSTANFSLNTVAGGGANLRAKGVPVGWPGNSGTTNFADLGAVQHQDGQGVGVVYAM